MVETSDIETLLQTGSWASSRAKSPQVPDYPVRANPPAKLDPDIPRAFNLGLHSANLPPPPSVEDEAQSLAREHGSSVVSGASDDEPKYRGDLEQLPILLPVPEFNPERRFVLVPNHCGETVDGREASNGTQSATEQTQRGKTLDDANDDCKEDARAIHNEGPNPKEPTKRPGVERRKSRQDLPHIDTGAQEHRHSPRMQRSRSATDVDQRPDHHFDAYNQPPRDGLLSPHIKYASTKGRDRAYWDYSAGQKNATSRNRPSGDDPRAPLIEKRRGDGYRATLSLDRPTHHRANSTESPKLARRASERDRYRDISSPRVATKGSSPPMTGKDSSSRQFDRSSASPPYPQSTRDREDSSGRHSGYKGRRASPPREEDEYPSDSHAKSPHPSRRRQSVLSQDGRNNLLSPDQLRPPVGGAPKSPLASPRIVQGQFPDAERLPSPRSATSPRDGKRLDTEEVSPFSSGSSPPKSGTRLDDGDQFVRAQARSRAASTNQGPSSSYVPTAVPIPIPAPSAAAYAVESRNSPVPSPSYSHENSFEASPAGSYRPPRAATGSHASWDRPIISYRRYLEDVQQGAAPLLPECRRKDPSAGHVDWLTLPHSVNFDICPDCYESVFSETSFKHSFVPAPLRGAETPVLCDFGSSPWYKIAWLMTLKHRIPDLHLLQGIAAAVAKGQKCSGSRPSTHIWYSILDPYNRRPISNFTVCQHCAKTAEVILPNLTGVFIPLDGPAEPTRGVCAMHFAPSRKRFVDIFDLLESVSDKALSRGSPPDFQRLANSVRELSLMPECKREEPVRDCKWFIMEPIPDLTVCEECFDQVVWPIVETDEKGSVARKFFQRGQRLPVAACQLYSDRMRAVFRKACRRNDMQYLEDKVKERLDIEAAIKTKLAEDLTEAETRELVRKWEEWE